MANLEWVHWDVVKRVFIYLRDTSKYSLCFHGYHIGPQYFMSIYGYVDSDWLGGINSRRSTHGYVFTIFNGVISWMIKWKVVVSLSTTKIEYKEATHACKEIMHLR